jgi:hypothetical protein
MAPILYYVNIGAPAAWNGRTGLDHTGNEFLGISGLQKALDIAVVTDIVYIKGTADASKWFTAAYDANAGNLTDGEEVTWDHGEGAWGDGTDKGVVHFSGAFAAAPSTLQIEVTTGTQWSDNDVIKGTTSGNTITASANAAASTIDVDINGGTNAAGWIKFIGVNASWNQDGTRAIIDFNSVAMHGFTLTTVADMTWWENIEVQECGASKNGFYFSGEARGCVFVNCCSHNNGSSGFDTIGGHIAIFIRCAAYSNTAYGYNLGLYNRALFCSAKQNTLDGFYNNVGAYLVLAGCISSDNTDDGVGAVSNTDFIFNCVVNGNDDDGIELKASTTQYIPLIVGCRITNQNENAADNGIYGGGEPYITMSCYFEDNGENIDAGDTLHQNVSTDGTGTSSNLNDTPDADEGYVAEGTDYGLVAAATLRRTAITIPLT